MNIIIDGKPIAQGRPRFVRRGKFTAVYDPNAEEKKRIKAIVLSQLTEKALNVIEFSRIKQKYAEKQIHMYMN